MHIAGNGAEPCGVDLDDARIEQLLVRPGDRVHSFEQDVKPMPGRTELGVASTVAHDRAHFPVRSDVLDPVKIDHADAFRQTHHQAVRNTTFPRSKRSLEVAPCGWIIALCGSTRLHVYQTLPNPYASALSSLGLAAPSCPYTVAQSLMPYPEFCGGVSAIDEPVGINTCREKAW